MDSPSKKPQFLKVIACEIAFREICHAAARSPNLHDLEFLTQGYHDVPCHGREEIQKRIDAVPAGKYEAILLGYGLCSNILVGLTSPHTKLVIPRAHDCITFFLGSKERYQELFSERPGSYYFTSGWLECRKRRGLKPGDPGAMFMPANATTNLNATYESWVKKYGEEKAQYLREVMGEWANHYSHGVLIDFDFTKPLKLDEQVNQICAERGWEIERVEGDQRRVQQWMDGEWREEDFLVVPPCRTVEASFDEKIIGLKAETCG